MHHEHASVPSFDIVERLQQALGAAYVIERELGGGGMSRIFLAREVALGRQVVVKLLPPEYAAGVNGERFRREILLAARLQHPHIVPILSAGEMNGVPYYTMPFIDGESLRARLQRGAGFSVAEVTRILHDVVDALAYAHEHGVVHRDIKPDNILMNRQHAVITDFGVAKALCAAHDEGCLSCAEHIGGEAGFAIGTPAYMAPEQAAADPSTDHRADLYGFGVLAYELLTGEPPFSGREPIELLAAHVAETPIPIRAMRPDVPEPLARLIMSCLAKQPEHRPASAAAIRDLLEDPAMTAAAFTVEEERPGFASRITRIAAGLVALLATGGSLVIGQHARMAGDDEPHDRERVSAPLLGTGLGDRQYLTPRRSAVELPPVAARLPGEREMHAKSEGHATKLLAKKPVAKGGAAQTDDAYRVTLRSEHGVTTVTTAPDADDALLLAHAARLQTIEAMLGEGALSISVRVDSIAVDRLARTAEAAAIPLVRSVLAPRAPEAAPRAPDGAGAAGSSASVPTAPIEPGRVVSLAIQPAPRPRTVTSEVECLEEQARRAREQAARAKRTRTTAG